MESSQFLNRPDTVILWIKQKVTTRNEVTIGEREEGGNSEPIEALNKIASAGLARHIVILRLMKKADSATVY
jgi:hypothetical protein